MPEVRLEERLAGHQQTHLHLRAKVGHRHAVGLVCEDHHAGVLRLVGLTVANVLVLEQALQNGGSISLQGEVFDVVRNCQDLLLQITAEIVQVIQLRLDCRSGLQSGTEVGQRDALVEDRKDVRGGTRADEHVQRDFSLDFLPLLRGGHDYTCEGDVAHECIGGEHRSLAQRHLVIRDDQVEGILVDRISGLLAALHEHLHAVAVRLRECHRQVQSVVLHAHVQHILLHRIGRLLGRDHSTRPSKVQRAHRLQLHDEVYLNRIVFTALLQCGIREFRSLAVQQLRTHGTESSRHALRQGAVDFHVLGELQGVLALAHMLGNVAIGCLGVKMQSTHNRHKDFTEAHVRQGCVLVPHFNQQELGSPHDVAIPLCAQHHLLVPSGVQSLVHDLGLINRIGFVHGADNAGVAEGQHVHRDVAGAHNDIAGRLDTVLANIQKTIGGAGHQLCTRHRLTLVLDQSVRSSLAIRRYGQVVVSLVSSASSRHHATKVTQALLHHGRSRALGSAMLRELFVFLLAHHAECANVQQVACHIADLVYLVRTVARVVAVLVEWVLLLFFILAADHSSRAEVQQVLGDVAHHTLG